MKIIDGQLFVEFSEAVQAGFSEGYLKKAKSTGVKSWHFIPDPSDQRKVLINYNALKPEYKAKFQNHLRTLSGCQHQGTPCHCGDPYTYYYITSIKSLFSYDAKAEQFFIDYKLPDGRSLPDEYIKKYTLAASWLYTLQWLIDNKAQLNHMHIPANELFQLVAMIIREEQIHLPTSEDRLKRKLNAFRKQSYQVLIEQWRFCNKNAARIGKKSDGYDEQLAQQQLALIRKAGRKHNNFDAAQISRAVNSVFSRKGWPTVSHKTIYRILKQHETILLPARRGAREFNAHRAMQVVRHRPQYPLYLLSIDGWTVELLYQNEAGFDNRLVMVVVLDAMNDYPLGYAIGDRENTTLIQQACKNALTHIKQLFGEYYRPWQLQSDHYGLKIMTPFYQSMAQLFTPAAVGNAKSKIVEPYFKYLNKNYCQYYPNWSGFNVDARRNNQPNREYLDKIKHSFPDRQGCIQQITYIIEQDRRLKQAAYLQRFNEMPDDDKVIITRNQYLKIFGQKTQPKQLQPAGLCHVINGRKIWFDTFHTQFRQMDQHKWHLYYDPDDLSTALAVTDDEQHSFLLHAKPAISMSLKELNSQQASYLQQVHQYNKQWKEQIIQIAAQDEQLAGQALAQMPLTLDDVQEARLKLMFTHHGQQKERIQDAKKLQPSPVAHDDSTEKLQRIKQLREMYLNSKTDFNQYID